MIRRVWQAVLREVNQVAQCASAASAFDYLCHVLLALLGRMGIRVECRAIRRGYYPRGGGFTARTVSSHARTAIWLIEQFLPVRFEVGTAGDLARVEVRGR